MKIQVESNTSRFVAVENRQKVIKHSLSLLVIDSFQIPGKFNTRNTGLHSYLHRPAVDPRQLAHSTHDRDNTVNAPFYDGPEVAFSQPDFYKVNPRLLSDNHST